MDIKERIKQYLEYKGVSDYRFEKDLSLSKGYINKAKNPTSDVLIKMCGIYTDISAEWLLMGEGEMLKQDNQTESTVSSGNTILGNGNITGRDMTNVGNTRHYEVPKKGFLKIIHPDGSEEDIVGDAGLLEALNENKMLRLENEYLKGIVKDKDKMINLLEKGLGEK